MKSLKHFAAGFAFLGLLSLPPALAQTNFATLTSDGGWCWFSDPRAIFHNGSLYFGCVRSDGHSTLNLFNLQTGKVTNLWVNRLIGDQQPDVTKKYTYTTQQFYRADSPLLPSGLLGPVRLIPAYEAQVR